MATPTYTLIDSTVLGSAASSVTFSGISATGKGDLVLAVDKLAGSGGATRPSIQFNGDTGSNYSYVVMSGSSGVTFSDSGTETSLRLNYATNFGTTDSGQIIIQISDFAATDKHKSALIRNNEATDQVEALATRWADTSAISSIVIIANTNNFAAGASFYLYQIVSE